MNIEDHEEYGADQIQILKGLEAAMRRWLAPATISR